MGRSRKTPKYFGKPGGNITAMRKKIHPGRPKATYKVACDPSSPSGYSVKNKLSLRLCRQRILSSYKKRSQKLIYHARQKYSSSYSVRNVSGTDYTSLKLKLSKLNNLTGNGYRVINLDLLQSHVSEITMHTALCEPARCAAFKGIPPIKLVSELRTSCLASVLLAECQGCKKTFQFETSPKVNASKRYEINVRAVWGSIVTGNGASHMNEFLGTLDSPGLSQPAFSAIEEEISEWWRGVLEDDMLAVGAEERQIAIDNGNFHDEVPSVTVVTDGGWCKRTHKHSYNALGGVAIIIGQKTKKLLHIGVRNKYCCICSRAETQHLQPKPHKCFRNWNESSQAMEADIIVEGFRQAEAKHGVRYMTVIGDGDSSVFARIREDVPVWGRFVVKLECANHVCKCFRSNLEKLVTDNPHYKGKHHLTKAVRVRLVSAVRCAIRVRSKAAETSCVNDKRKIAKLLSSDIQNACNHVFGNHIHCSDFCKAKAGTTCSVNSTCDSLLQVPSPDNLETVTDVIEDQIHMWTEGTSLDAQEESRMASDIEYTDVERFIVQDVGLILNRIADKSDRLLGNLTTNLAECWMHIRSKFDGGKLYNICSRGSWHGRCYGGALRMNLGPQWSPNVWQTVTASLPGNHFLKLYEQKDRQLLDSLKYKAKPETRAKRWKSKVASLKQSGTKKARQSYGPEAVDVSDDVNVDIMEEKQQTFLGKNINISENQIKAIETSTKQQSQSGLWHSERRKRLTASHFGSIVKRNVNNQVTPLVKRLLYGSFQGNRHTRNGLQQERVSIQEYILKKAEHHVNVSVEAMGLVVHPQHKFLAGSPDGMVKDRNGTGDTGLLEVKNLLHHKPCNLWQAAVTEKSFCLELKSKELSLKRNHLYYYQCQGVLNICGLEWLDFVVRTVNPYQIHIERIQRDTQLWNTTMLPKLHAFYYHAILPELACPREGKSPGIREPGVWFTGPVLKTVSRKRKAPKVKTTTSTATLQEKNCCQEVVTNVSRAIAPPTNEQRLDTRHSVQRTDSPKSSCSSTATDPTYSTNPNVAQRLQGVTRHSIQRTDSPKPSCSSTDPKDSINTIVVLPLHDITRRSIQTSSVTIAKKPSCTNSIPPTIVQPQQGTTRSTRRVQKVKFVGRRISHQWRIDEVTNARKWCTGTVLGTVSGVDGQPNAVYEVDYEEEEESLAVGNLYHDYKASSVKFVDI